MKLLARHSLSPLALEILAYLRTHKDAQDTDLGIAEWWLLEQRLRVVMREVREALAELVAQRVVLELSSADGRVHYRLDPRRRGAVDRMLKEYSDEPKSAERKSRAAKTPRQG